MNTNNSDVWPADIGVPVNGVELWNSAVPFPAAAEIESVRESRAVVVHRADADYAFLHDCQIVMYHGALFASWYNCPLKEMEDASVIRGSCSRDGGRSWAGPSVIAQAPDDGFMYVPNVFGVHKDRLWCFALRMDAADLLIGGIDLFRLDDAEQQWELKSHIPVSFLPNHPPIMLPDGRAVMAGRTPLQPGGRPLVPAVAVCSGSDWQDPWTLRPLLPPGETLPCPETTLLVEEHVWTAIIRPGDWVRGNPGRTALVSSSHDEGETWTLPCASNLPMQPSKAFAGVLSTGQRYLILNSPGSGQGGRELLTLLVSPRNDRRFSRAWRLQSGPDPVLGCGPEWSYPCAVEAEGNLFIIYTSEKHHSVMRTVPVAALYEA